MWPDNNLNVDEKKVMRPLNAAEKWLANNDKVITAIKCYREDENCSLSIAKEKVDAYRYVLPNLQAAMDALYQAIAFAPFDKQGRMMVAFNMLNNMLKNRLT